MSHLTSTPLRAGLLVTALLCALAVSPAARAGGGALEIRNGYFWDPVTTNYFIPRGIAYQTWNPPVGANQSFAQLDYDLVEFKKMYATSVRCEMVWNEVERSQGSFDWSKPDFLVQKAEELGLKLFVLIGFQFGPDWFANEWKAINDQGSNSVMLAYENPNARLAYSNYIAKVTSHYKNSRAIGAWILGNEFAYFDLWDPARRFLGFDPISLTNFRAYLSGKYTGNIAALNGTWGTSYSSFNAIPMPQMDPPDRNNPAYHDLIQWRKKSIGGFVALGATAAQLSDPNHLRTYSMVGGLFGEADIHYTAEDARTIVSSCAAAGAPLDFWSINNYAIAALDSELRSADFGIGKHQAASGLPVLVTETGHTSTEDLHAGAAERQAAALPRQLWEALMSGAIGVHLFTWNDRDLFSGNYFPREKGFGIVHQNRLIKDPAYWNVLETFRRMEQLRLGQLLGGTINPPSDIYFFWSQSSDLGWPRANHENIRIWSTLKRLGYQPRIIDDADFDSGAWAGARALLLSRSFQLDPRHLDMIVSNVVPAGIHVHASADLPGQYNAYHKPNPKWAQQMSSLFGLDVSNAVPGWDAGAVDPDDLYRQINFTGVQALGPITNGYADFLGTWKIWHGLATSSGTTIVRHRGLNGTQLPMPALHVKTIGAAKTAINTFAIGDITEMTGQSPPHTWDLRYAWLRAIYRDHFGLAPPIDLSGPGARYVFPDYRVCSNGSVLISLQNGHTNGASVTLAASNLLSGKTVENLTTGGIVENNSDGVLTVSLGGDQYVLLYAYSSGGRDSSLINPDPHKLWFESAPVAVWPNTAGYGVNIGYDTRGENLNLHVSFELARTPNKTYGQSAGLSVIGKTNRVVQVPIPDADLNDPDYTSTPAGGNYVWHAWLEQNGVKVSETFLPVRLLWGVRPVSPLPENIMAGHSYPITVEWQELPSYEPGDPTPLSRADLWDSLQANAQHYDIVLELKGANGQVIASTNVVTSTGTSSNQLVITAPGNATGPFTWSASLLTATNVLSHDVVDSFEGRTLGAKWPSNLDYDFLTPWGSYHYPPDLPLWQNEGVQLEGSDGAQSAFLVTTNMPGLAFSGFGLAYVYPNDWALPDNTNQWTNYVFSYDFKEKNGLGCVLEMQVKSTNEHWIEFSQTYDPARSPWNSIRASLKDFARIDNQFDPKHIKTLVANIRMVAAPAQFVGAFDNLQFHGPEIDRGGGTQISFYSSTNDFFGIRSIVLDPPGQVVISWLGTGTLEFADEVSGRWSSAPGNSNPRILPQSGARKFYRLSR